MKHHIAVNLAVLLVAATMAQAGPASRPATQPASRPLARTGTYHVTFTDQSPLSPAKAQNDRYRLALQQVNRYKLEEESFEVCVPEGDADQPYGIFVWVSPGDRGNSIKPYLPVLERKHLIWIGPNQVGDPRGLGVRLGLPLDAVHNLRQRYAIDERRIYIAGLSGGGKIASIAAVCYPEVFTGAIAICGTSYFRDIPVPGQPGKFWPGIYARPPIKFYDLARQKGRFVLMTDENDGNREPTKEFYDKGFLKDRFQHIEYVEVPGMGHTLPEAKWIEQAIDSLDRPINRKK